MSGGSHNYECFRFEEEYCEQMRDPVMNELVHDLVPVLHDLEWWDSADIGEEGYRETVAAFKKKWLGDSSPVLRDVIIQETDRMRQRLLIALAWTGGEDGQKTPEVEEEHPEER